MTRAMKKSTGKRISIISRIVKQKNTCAGWGYLLSGAGSFLISEGKPFINAFYFEAKADKGTVRHEKIITIREKLINKLQNLIL